MKKLFILVLIVAVAAVGLTGCFKRKTVQDPALLEFLQEVEDHYANIENVDAYVEYDTLNIDVKLVEDVEQEVIHANFLELATFIIENSTQDRLKTEAKYSRIYIKFASPSTTYVLELSSRDEEVWMIWDLDDIEPTKLKIDYENKTLEVID